MIKYINTMDDIFAFTEKTRVPGGWGTTIDLCGMTNKSAVASANGTHITINTTGGGGGGSSDINPIDDETVDELFPEGECGCQE